MEPLSAMGESLHAQIPRTTRCVSRREDAKIRCQCHPQQVAIARVSLRSHERAPTKLPPHDVLNQKLYPDASDNRYCTRFSLRYTGAWARNTCRPCSGVHVVRWVRLISPGHAARPSSKGQHSAAEPVAGHDHRPHYVLPRAACPSVAATYGKTRWTVFPNSAWFPAPADCYPSEALNSSSAR